MRKKVLLLMAAVASLPVAAEKKTLPVETADADSLRTEQLEEVVVKGVWSKENAPFAVSNVKRQSLDAFSKTGRELPFLLALTPGVTAWSENGLGTGTTYMRIRGAGDSRINVTLDGVPLNSPEDQCVFWANMNSYASLLGRMQVQRGVGSSVNGDGAFGGTVALQTASPSTVPMLELTGSLGSFGTLNVGGSFSTGRLWKHLVFDGAYHETSTDGFVHGTAGRSGSYYGGLTWLGDNFQIRYKNIGNFEKTGQAWKGVTAGTNDLSIMDGTYGMATGIKTYKDMWDKGLGKYNSLYEQLTIHDDGTYSTSRYQMADGSLWRKATDNFWQNHNILSAVWQIDSRWATTASLHYTHGYGYYNEFRPQNKLSKFGMTATDASGKEIKRADFIRKKGLSQDTYGAVWNLNYKDQDWDIVGGLSLQNFDGNHFGYVTYTSNDDVRAKYLADGKYQYYDSDAHKLDGSAFVKATLHIVDGWDVFADMQYRHVGYKTDGINDKFYDDASGYYNQPLDIDKKYDFLNPKAGFSWTGGHHRVYGSVAASHREPERNNFTDNGSYPAPKAEELTDFELGYDYRADRWHASANLYYMDYTDQFVQTGAQSDIGENLTTNIKDSYRMGVELQAGIDLTSWLSLEGNAALSKNKVKDFDEVVEDWDQGERTIHYSNSTLAFSPSAILNGFLLLRHRGWQATWHTNYVSRQYLDNTACRDRSLPGYSTSNLHLGYTLKCKKALREAAFSLSLNNLFDHHYAASGWVYSAIYESGGHANDNRYYQIGFVPMAGFNMMGNVTLRF